MAVQLKNNVSGFLASGISAGATSVTLQAGQGITFPTLSGSQYFYATIVDTAGNLEIVKATARAGDTLTVVRGQDGTTARAFPSLSRIELRVNAGTIYEVIDASISTTPLVVSNIASVIRVAEDIDNVVLVAADIDNINAVIANQTDIDTVAGNMPIVVTVSTNIAAVTSVANNTANINAVNANKTNIDIVAADIGDVIATGSNITNVNAVANELGAGQDVTVVAANLQGTDTIGTVAADIVNVNAVGSNIADVLSVAAELGVGQDVTVVAANLQGTDTIGTVAASIANVDAVGNNITKVNAVAAELGVGKDVTVVADNLQGANTVGTVASSIADVNTVASELGLGQDVTVVATNLLGTNTIGTVAVSIATVNSVGNNILNVNTVAASISNVNTVATNISNVNTVATNVANVNSVGSSIASVNTVGSNIADVNTVAGVSSNVTTVAGSIANVNTVSSNISNVNTVAGNDSNITTVATNIADIQTTVANLAVIEAADEQAALASSYAAQSAGSAAQALAIYGSTAAVQSAVQTAASQASLAAGYAASAASVVQQDLSGVTAQALHRSPNAITSMFVYDTSKDSDGGAWTEKCQHTSWWNETIYGKWLGAQASELDARCTGSTRGAELVTLAALTPTASFTFANDVWTLSNSASNSETISFGGLTPGKLYAITVTVQSLGSGSLSFRHPNSSTTFGPTISSAGSYTTYFAASGATVWLRNSAASQNAVVSGFSVREVTALTTASGDYYQLSTDGKFYRLWKNLFAQSNNFASYSTTNVTTTATTVIAPDGTVLTKVLETTATGEHAIGLGNLSAALPAAGPFTISFYAYAAERSKVGITYPTTGDAGIAFDLAAGTALGAGTGTFVSSSITALGGGFYWCALTYTRPTSIAVTHNIHLLNDTATGITTRSYTGDASKGLFIGGFQLEWGTLTSYEVKTGLTTQTEVFRGNKRDFPRLAAFVAEINSISIYDLTEPGRPMWMRFFGSNNQCVVRGTNLSSLSVLNGLLYIGHGSSIGLARVDFTRDKATLITTAGEFMPRPISGRNDGAFSYTLATNTSQGPSIVNATVNAVAMTVLPDAPVDPVTGLKVPTIAVATGGGISVIQHSGTVRNSATTAAQAAISISPQILASQRSVSQDWNYALNPGSLGASFAVTSISSGAPDFARSNGVKHIAASRSNFLRFPSAALVSALRHNEVDRTKGVSSVITNTFNTGWMTGDIRRAYLSDVDTGSISAAEAVTNGTFATDITGWTGGIVGTSTAISWNAAGSMNLPYTDGSNYAYATQEFSTVANCVYKFSCSAITANIRVRIGASGFGISYLAETTVTAGTTLTTYFTAGAATATVTFFGATNSTTPQVDNVSAVAVIADRSYKAKPASIYGTLSRAVVATGAQLVAYSSFSGSNYAQEPYSADLDFGTAEWTASAWVNAPVTLPDSSFANVGSELVSNGAFNADITGWTNSSTGTGTIAWNASGSIDLTGTDANNRGRASQVITCVAGKTYRIKWNATGAAYNVSVGTGVASTTMGNFSSGSSGYFVASQTSVTITLLTTSAGGTATLDNISVFEVAPALIADRAFASGSRIGLGVTGTGLLTATAYDGTTTRTATTTVAYNIATWLKVRASYTTDGTLAVMVNGVEVAATRGNPLLTLNNSNAVLTIGNSYALDAPFPGSIALLKFSATVPTTEQALWMYEQEKQMFREGAKVCLPDAGSIVDLTYDEATDKWIAVSATNESEWSGLVRTSVTAVPVGSYTKASAGGGVQLLARSTTNPGADVTIPAYGLREELVKRAEAAARLNAQLATLDYAGGFTANTTTGNTAILNVANLTYPTSYIGAVVTGSGIPADTVVVAVSGTTIYLSKAATATATGVAIAFSDFILPVGYEAKEVSLAGAAQREGATAQFTRRFDGFKETIRFGTPPSNTALIQIQAVRSVV